MASRRMVTPGGRTVRTERPLLQWEDRGLGQRDEAQEKGERKAGWSFYHARWGACALFTVR
jgi:hypothetical protein